MAMKDNPDTMKTNEVVEDNPKTDIVRKDESFHLKEENLAEEKALELTEGLNPQEVEVIDVIQEKDVMIQKCS